MQKAWQRLLLSSGAIFFKFRNFLFPIFVIILLVFTRPALAMARSDVDTFVIIAGCAIALLGGLFRLFVIGFAYIKRGGKDGRVYADDLVTGGVYAHVRNPMYIGNFLIIVGMGMMYGSMWIYALVIPFFAFVYLSIVVTEEDYLKKRFGQGFEAYCKKVNRFIPNFSGFGKTLSEFSYDWKKAIRKDYGTFFGVLIGCYIIWLRKMQYSYGVTFTGNKTFLLLLPLVIVALLYSWVRVLKKRGSLRS